MVQYLGRVQQCEVGLKAERDVLEARGETFDDIIENEHYLKRLDAGLHTLQHVDLIIGEVLYKCGAAAAERATALLRSKSSPFGAISAVLIEYGDNVDESTAVGAAARSDVQALVMVLGSIRTD